MTTDSGMTRPPSDLVAVTEAARMLAQARTLPEIKRVHNLAQRAQDYAKAARLGLDAQNSAAAIRLEAEAKAGELLVRLKDTGERQQQGGDRSAKSQPASLVDLGVTRDESSRWQAVAAVPAEERAAYVAETQQREEEVTRAGLLRRAGLTTAKRAASKAAAVEEAVFTEAELARRRLEGVVSLELLPAVETIAADSDYLTPDEHRVIEGAVRTLTDAVARKGLRVISGAV